MIQAPELGARERRHHELSDEEWAIIAPLLPNKGRGAGGRPPGDQWHPVEAPNRRSVAGCAGALRSAHPLYNRFVRWRAAGVWDRLLEAVSAAYDGDIVMIDSTRVRVHQHGAAIKKGALTIVAWDAPGAG